MHWFHVGPNLFGVFITWFLPFWSPTNWFLVASLSHCRLKAKNSAWSHRLCCLRMSFELNNPDELHLPSNWDYDFLPEHVVYDDDSEDWDEVFWYSSSIFRSKMHELFACSKSVLAQSFGKLGFIMILCLTWRLLYLLLVSVFHNPGK